VEIKTLLTCKGQVNKQEKKMKKKIGLVLLLIAVTAGMAFAQKVGDNLSFSQQSETKSVKVISVKKTKSGVEVEYQALKDIKKMSISGWVYVKKNDAMSDMLESNTERSKKQGKTYKVSLKSAFGVNYWDEKGFNYVGIIIDGIESDDSDFPSSGGSKQTAPKEPKKDWVDKNLPPLKL
jgi:hypothetical protein